MQNGQDGLLLASQAPWQPQQSAPCLGATDPVPPHICLITLLQSTLLQGEVPQGPAEPSQARTNMPLQAGVYLQLSTSTMDLQGIQIQLTVQTVHQQPACVKALTKIPEQPGGAGLPPAEGTLMQCCLAPRQQISSAMASARLDHPTACP